MDPETLSEPASIAGAELARDAFATDERLAEVARRLGSTVPVRARVSDAALPVVLAAIHELRSNEPRRALSVLVADDEAARELAEAVRAYTPDCDVAYYPHRGVEWGSPLPPATHLVGERARALRVLQAGGIVCVSADAVVERIPPRPARPEPVQLRRGQTLDRDHMVERLVDAGYERVGGTLDERGTFSARGDMVDIFPSTGREPIRIELYVDEVERVCTFSSLTQRSLRDLDHAVIEPARERADEAVALPLDESEAIAPDLVPIIPELLAAGALIVWDRERVLAACEERLSEVALGRSGRRRGYLRSADVAELVGGACVFDQLPQGQPWSFDAQRPALAARGIAEAENELRSFLRTGHRVLVAFPHRGDALRTAAQLRRVEARLAAGGEPLSQAPQLVFVVSRLRTGFVSNQQRLAVLPSAQLLRRAGTGTALGRSRAMASFTDLRSGDFVVHEDHGVGRFVGFDTKTVAGVTRDYLCLDFNGADKLFVPHEQMGKVSRYIGADGRAPALSRLGGKAWQTLKARARHAVHELAGHLLALYAARQAAHKPPVAADGELTHQIEAAFTYVETDDQARAIDAVKTDLEAPRPMDRLICGDVGFGKTEVAMRAAAKVVEGGRQVLMLCPTTILAQQHYGTFTDRFRDTAVEIDLASRFRDSAALKQTISAFRAGRLDVLIGTHRVLSRDVIPANLGLVIVDEEQRFGVAQKEILRQLRTEVDVIALSATPIPRTLHMSLAGLRDISVIATPPRGRRPVRTHVGEYDAELVAHALRREIGRGGQAFYLHNRVESIDEAAARLGQLVPEARIGVAHGKMSERQLERVMQQFLRGDHDVLCATTIIESGLDIPAANTLIVERSDLLGLSQLYQIRGRVGRSDQAAYAYLFYPDTHQLTGEAAARLAALADYTELGAGFRIAMRDLELRGAGNLLGDEQSGHVAAVGFELYCDLLAEAVTELHGAPRLPAAALVRVDAAVDAYVPAAYVGLEAAKIDVHRRIALASAEDDLRDLELELADRFGPVPEPVANLIGLQAVRLALEQFGAVSVVVRPDRAAVGGVALGAEEVRHLRSVLDAVTYNAHRREVTIRLDDDTPAVEAARRLVAGIVEVRSGAAAASPPARSTATLPR